jgi:hypothetical protein
LDRRIRRRVAASRRLVTRHSRGTRFVRNIAYLFTDDSHKYFELDSGTVLPHSGNASRTSIGAVILKHSFVAGSVAALQIS